MRKLYSALTYLVAPLLPLYLKKRGKKNPAYLDNWSERFGYKLTNPSTKPIIWLHSVSVGETRAMQKLVELITSELPEYQILITTMTPTGRATAHQLYPQAIIHYVPYDLSFCVKQFYRTFKPKLGVIMETEIWPNLIHFADHYQIPLYLVNARLSNRSCRGYQRFNWALMPIINQLAGILCQDQQTATNFSKLNYQGKLQVVGNTKFDLVITPSIKSLINNFATMFGARKIITFASTREGEDKLFLDNLTLRSDVLYLIIPRHPERFSELEELLKSHQISYQKRSANQTILPSTQVVIGDSMGEMLAYYAISYLAVIGGSFTDCGGQNPIEAIFMGVPVIFGSSMYNFTEVAKNCLTDGCGVQLTDVTKLNAVFDEFVMNNEQYQQIRVNCVEFTHKYQGASQRIFAELITNLK